MMLDRAVGLGVRVAEDFQRLVLGRGRKREIAGVGEQFARLHQTVDLILIGLLLGLLTGLGERLGHGRAGAAALAGVSLVNDNREVSTALLVADLVEDERETSARSR